MNHKSRSRLSANARSLALKTHFPPRDNKPYCSLCKHTGALLPCDRCPRSYHLVCLGLKESDVGLAWVCINCVDARERKMRDEARKLVKDQRAKKERILSEMMVKLTAGAAEKSYRRFARRHPECVKQGKIVYPIDDRLLLIDPKLHQIDFISPIPKPQATSICPQLLGDLVYICDFCFTFRGVLSLRAFTPEQLYISLSGDCSSLLLKEVLMTLVLLVTRQMMRRENVSDVYGVEAGLGRLLYVMKGPVKLVGVMPFVYLKLLEDALESPYWREFVEENLPLEAILMKKADFPFETYFFSDYCSTEKLEILFFLINCALDCKEIHEELTTRLDSKDRLKREKHEICAEIKSLESQQSATRSETMLLEQISIQEKRLESVRAEAESLNVRSNPIGSDRDFREYYVFGFEPGRVYVRLDSPIDTKRAKNQCESGYWYTLSPGAVSSLVSALCVKGVRESELLAELQTRLPRLLAERIDEGATLYVPNSALALVLCDYHNPESQFESVDGVFSGSKAMLKQTELRFSEYLLKVRKYWEMESDLVVWRTCLKSASTPEQLKPLLRDFAFKSKNPYKAISEDCSDDTSEQYDSSVTTKKYRKVVLHVWQDFGDAWQAWVELLERANSRSEIAGLVCILSSVLRYYAKHKAAPSPVPKASIEVPKEPRRIITRQHFKRKQLFSSSSSDSHESVCLLCQTPGDVLACEGCKHTVHPMCIGLPVWTYAGNAT